MLLTLLCTVFLCNEVLAKDLQWDLDWSSSDLNLVPPLPIAAPNSTNEKCRQDSVKVIQGLQNMALWAEQMWDASAKAPVGVTFGSRFQLGDFDECLSIRTPVEAQYCLVEVILNVPPGHNTTDPYIIDYDPNLSVWDKIYYGGSEWKFAMDNVNMAVCVPASCSPEDLTKAINDHLVARNNTRVASVSIQPKLCSQNERLYDRYLLSDIVFCMVVVFAALMTTFSTIYDSMFYDSQKDWKWNVESRHVDFIMYFSARRAIKSMFKRESTIKSIDITPLCGITFLSCFIITIGHRWAFLFSGPVQYNYKSEKVYYNWISLIFISHPDLIVDAFFTMSGCIAVFLTLNRMENHKVKFWHIVIARYLRLTPAYAMVIFFYATFYYKMGDGPLWNVMVGTETENCKSYWWTNLLYINNYVHTDTRCDLHSWYMPCEFHFGLAIIPLCYLYHSKPKVGIKVALFALLIATIIPFYITMNDRLPVNQLFNTKFYRQPHTHEYFRDFYSKSHTRAGPYIIGSILGCVLHNYKGNKISQAQTWLYSWLGFIIMCVSYASGAIFYYPYTPYNVYVVALYSSTIRSIWSFGLAIFIYSLLTGSETFFRSFFTWKPFIPLSAISFNTYLLNLILPTSTTASLRYNNYLNGINLVSDVLGDFVIDTFVGLLLFVAIERPFRLVGNSIRQYFEVKRTHIDIAVPSDPSNEVKQLPSTHHSRL